ncbi:hypothetical protein DMENIID0001_037740 [Sergentomyia squamirostris]
MAIECFGGEITGGSEHEVGKGESAIHRGCISVRAVEQVNARTGGEKKNHGRNCSEQQNVSVMQNIDCGARDERKRELGTRNRNHRNSDFFSSLCYRRMKISDLAK